MFGRNKTETLVSRGDDFDETDGIDRVRIWRRKLHDEVQEVEDLGGKKIKPLCFLNALLLKKHPSF